MQKETPGSYVCAVPQGPWQPSLLHLPEFAYVLFICNIQDFLAVFCRRNALIPSCLELERRWVLKRPHEGTALLFPITFWGWVGELNQEATLLAKIRWDTPNLLPLPDTGHPGGRHGSHTPRRLRTSSSAPGKTGLLCCELVRHPQLPQGFPFLIVQG